MATRMLQRRGTAAEWAAANPVLGDGEVGVERDTGIIKIGDGVTAWASLTNEYIRKTAMDAAYSPIGAIPAGLVDAAGDIIVATGADAVARLPKGTNGQQLKISDAGAVAWETPPATDLSSRIPYSIIDAAGDLIVGSGSDTIIRLAKGSNGQVLTVDGSGVVSWATPASGTLTVTTQTGAYSVAAGVGVVLANGTFTVTLPTAASSPGRVIDVKNIGTGTITVATSGGNIDGSATAVLATRYHSITVVSDGTNWHII